MKTEDTLLIGKFLEGSIVENESKLLLQKLENKEISIVEFQELAKMHGILYAEFHVDKNVEKLSKIVDRAIGEKKSNLSERVIRRIEYKKKNKFNWALAAVLFLSLMAGVIIYISSTKTITSPVPKHLITDNSALLGNTIENDTPAIKTHYLPDGSSIELYPHTSINSNNNLIILEKGKLLATIKKQKVPLNFKAGDSLCKILGTKFLLETAIQKDKPTTELIVTEGLVEMHAFDKKELVKINQRCIATGYDQNLNLSDLVKNEVFNKSLNPKIVYYSLFENQKLEKFWENWSYDEALAMQNSKKLNLVVKGENTSSFITSKVFKTYYRNISYHIELLPTINQGVMDVSITFSKKGIPYHQDGFILTKGIDKSTVQSYQITGGIRKEKEKGNFQVISTPFRFTGTINHLFTQNTPHGEKIVSGNDLEPGKFTISKEEDTIEDVSIKIEVKSIGKSDGKIELLNAIIERITENSKK